MARALQRAWPGTHFTWIIGQSELRLIGLASDIEFLPFDKRAGIAEFRRMRRLLAGREFDVLLHMQLAVRASLLTTAVRSPVRVGFDRARAREGQWLFTNQRIAAGGREHVLDTLFGFAAALGVTDREPHWDLVPPALAREQAAQLAPDGQPTMVISACSSHPARNWRPERYAAVADHAIRAHGMQVLLAGGPDPRERRMADAIIRHARGPLIDLVGRDTLPGLLALLERATVLLTPDSGPAHIATMAGTPVIGLYAATNPARTGPYLSRRWCVDRYADAVRRFLGRDADEVRWTTKVERPGVMDLIAVEEVTARLDELVGADLAGTARRL